MSGLLDTGPKHRDTRVVPLPPGRPVYSGGPIIRRLSTVSLVHSVLIVLALLSVMVVVLVFAARQDAIQASRRAAQVSNCLLLTRVIDTAYAPNPAAGQRLILEAGISNCQVYARRLTPSVK